MNRPSGLATTGLQSTPCAVRRRQAVAEFVPKRLTVPQKRTDIDQAGLAAKLLDWYRGAGRALPWRQPPGSPRKPDAYRVWLSEIMLQQTTVKAVLPRYDAFLRRWPTVTALAEAPLGDVLAEWAGLGYYARARNLHACARTVATELGGKFPDREARLRSLPGIGAYTAAAIAAIAFGRRVTPVDGNVERVVARLFALSTPLPKGGPEIARLARALAPARRAGDFAQALMDLGAGICTSRRPACALCPLRQNCAGHARGIANLLPYRATKAARPIRVGTAFLALRPDGAVLLRERPPKGLLGGMLEVPSSPWLENGEENDASAFAPLRLEWRRLPGLVEHVFTHFHLKLTIYRGQAPLKAKLTAAAEPQRCRWVAREDLSGAALPSLMRKVLAHGAVETRPPRPAPASGAQRSDGLGGFGRDGRRLSGSR
jgi:A/G-specific adenine glycosylase